MVTKDYNCSRIRMQPIEWTQLLLILSTGTTIQGAINVACTPTSPMVNSPVLCECVEDNGDDIDWMKDGSIITTCTAGPNFCSPLPPGYSFNSQISGSAAYYNLTITSYNYADCGQYSCRNYATSPEVAHYTTTISVFDSTMPTQFDEPGSNHTSGKISITTECVFDKDDVTGNIQWYKVINNQESLYQSPRLTVNEDTTSCSSCSGQPATKLIINNNHEEASTSVEKVQFRLKLYHNRDPSDKIVLTTKYFYYIQGDGGTTGDGFPPGAIAVIAIGCVVVITFIIIIVVRCKYKPKIIKIEPTDSTITITWSGQSKQQMFYLSYKETSTTADWNSEGPISYPEKEITHTVDNLTPATSYEVNLYSKCCILKSKKAVCTTKTEGIPYFITVVTHDTSHELTADPTLVLHHAERKEEAKQLLSKEKLKKEMFSYYSFHVELQQMLSPLSILEIELRNMSEDPSFFCEHVIVYCPNTGTYQDFRCHEWLDSRKRLIISDKKPEKKGRSWNEYLQLIANMRLKGVEKGTISYFITVVTDGDSVEIKADPIIVLHHAEKRDETRKSFSKNKLKQGKFNYHSFHIELQKNLSPLSSVEIELTDSGTGLSFICKNVVVYCPDTGLYQDFPCHKPLVSRITLVKNQLKEEKKGSSWKEYLKHIAEMDLSSDEDEL